MKRLAIVFSIVLFHLNTGFCQVNLPVPQVADSLSFMLGTWTGDGWIRMGPKKETFQLTEIISSKVDGAVLSIDGLGVATDSVTNETKKVHDAFGVVYYDAETKEFRITAFSSAAAKKDVEFKVANRVLTWGFKTDNGGMVRFTEDFSKDGKWTTLGEYSADGSRWFAFMQYNLERK